MRQKDCKEVDACTDGKFKCVWKEGNCFRESINLKLAEIVCEVAVWTELV